MNLEFTREKETPNKVRFAETVAEDQTPAIGTLYLTKEKVEELGIENEVVVTIDAP